MQEGAEEDGDDSGGEEDDDEDEEEDDDLEEEDYRRYSLRKRSTVQRCGLSTMPLMKGNSECCPTHARWALFRWAATPDAWMPCMR